MRVSVLLPAYDAERYLAATLDSVLAQTHRDFECLVLDDGSRDRTLEIARGYAARDPRIAAHAGPHRGAGATLNHGLSIATSEWVAVIHADDVMLPHRLERQIAFVRAHPGLAVAASNVGYIDRHGRRIGHFRSALTDPAAVREQHGRGRLIGFHHPTAMLRRSVVLAAGGYDPTLEVCEDIELWNRLVELGHSVLVQPEELVLYRIHGGALSVVKRHQEQLRLQWLEDNLRRRNRGETARSWQAFREARGPSGAGEARRSWSLLRGVLYKRLVVAYANRDWLALTVLLSGCLLLNPLYVLRKAGAKWEVAAAGRRLWPAWRGGPGEGPRNPPLQGVTAVERSGRSP